MKGLLRLALVVLGCAASHAGAQGSSEQRELTGQLGNRNVLVVLNSTREPDGTWRITGEYLILSTLVRRFLEGERSPQLGVTTLREGATPILFGRAPTATLLGTWRNGRFQGSRRGPGGQEREKFQFTEQFPPLDSYGAEVRCENNDDRYQSLLAFVVEKGRLKPGSFEWRTRVLSSGHACTLGTEERFEQRAFAGGLQWAASAPGQGGCRVTLRDLGEYVRVVAEDCQAHCGTQAYFEPVLLERRNACRLMRPQVR